MVALKVVKQVVGAFLAISTKGESNFHIREEGFRARVKYLRVKRTSDGWNNEKLLKYREVYITRALLGWFRHK